VSCYVHRLLKEGDDGWHNPGNTFSSGKNGKMEGRRWLVASGAAGLALLGRARGEVDHGLGRDWKGEGGWAIGEEKEKDGPRELLRFDNFQKDWNLDSKQSLNFEEAPQKKNISFKPKQSSTQQTFKCVDLKFQKF
jgi:hypothetical protein